MRDVFVLVRLDLTHGLERLRVTGFDMSANPYPKQEVTLMLHTANPVINTKPVCSIWLKNSATYQKPVNHGRFA